MKNLLKNAILFLALIPLITGCRLAYKAVFGVSTKYKWQTEKDFSKQVQKYELSSEHNLVMDTVAYFNGLREIYSKKFKALNVSPEDSSAFFKLKKISSDDTQATQFRLFDKEGAEVFKLVNCYIEPPIPVSWNVDSCFDKYPPTINHERAIFHYFDLNFLLSVSSTPDHKKLQLKDLPESDYYGVVFWNNYYQKPSRKLIESAKAYAADPDHSIHLIFMSNHNAFLWEIVDADTREEIKELEQKVLNP